MLIILFYHRCLGRRRLLLRFRRCQHRRHHLPSRQLPGPRGTSLGHCLRHERSHELWCQLWYPAYD